MQTVIISQHLAGRPRMTFYLRCLCVWILLNLNTLEVNANGTDSYTHINNMTSFTEPMTSFPDHVTKSSEGKLIERLLKDYNKKGRPRKNSTETVNVNIRLTLLNIDELNERNQFLKSYVWLNQIWHDDYLMWDPVKEGVTYLTLPSTDIWQPDLVIRNNIEQMFGDLLNRNGMFHLKVFSDGTIYMSTSGRLITACLIDVTYFPFDRQACYIHIESWSLDAQKLWLELRNDSSSGFSLESYRQNAQWKVVNHSTIANAQTYTYTYRSVKFVVQLERKTAYYIQTLFVPCLLLSVIVLMVFLLPPDSDQRVGLCITLMLAFTVFQVILVNSLPTSSDHTPIASVYFICVLLLTTLCLMSTLLVMHLHLNPHANPPPSCLIKLTRSNCGRMLGVTPTPHTDIKEEISCTSEGIDETSATKNATQCMDIDKNEDKRSQNVQLWVDTAMLFDRLFLILFLMLFVTVAVVLLGVYPLTRPQHVHPQNVS